MVEEKGETYPKNKYIVLKNWSQFCFVFFGGGGVEMNRRSRGSMTACQMHPPADTPSKVRSLAFQ